MTLKPQPPAPSPRSPESLEAEQIAYSQGAEAYMEWKNEHEAANSLREVRPDDGSPSCHVCGSIMVPASKGFKCFSCGATTEPTGPAPSVVESPYCFECERHITTVSDHAADCKNSHILPAVDPSPQASPSQGNGESQTPSFAPSQVSAEQLAEVADRIVKKVYVCGAHHEQIVKAIIPELAALAATPPQPPICPHCGIEAIGMNSNPDECLHKPKAEATLPLVGSQRINKHEIEKLALVLRDAAKTAWHDAGEVPYWTIAEAALKYKMAEATPAAVGKCEMCSQPIDDQVAFLNRELANFRRNAGYAWREGMMEAMKIFGDSITYREATKAIMERIGERGREAEAYASSSRAAKR